MHMINRQIGLLVLLIALVSSLSVVTDAQDNSKIEILADSALTRIVPTSFYFAGQSAPTQMRNSAAAKLGKDRFVIAGLVDTSGYSTEISGKYEGFLITDSPVMVGGKPLGTGAYGFGSAKNGAINIFDLSSKLILSVESKNDSEIKRPRPLQMSSSDNGVRLYKGKSYILIKAR